MWELGLLAGDSLFVAGDLSGDSLIVVGMSDSSVFSDTRLDGQRDEA